MTDGKGAGEPFAKAIRKGVLIAQDLEPGMSIMVGGYVFTGKYTAWADQINREFDERVKAERELNWKIVVELCGVNPHTHRPCIEKVDEKFWCPVCKCAGSIRGGQDGE